MAAWGLELHFCCAVKIRRFPLVTQQVPRAVCSLLSLSGLREMQNSQQLSSCPPESTGSGSWSVSYSAARRKPSQGRSLQMSQTTGLRGVVPTGGHPQSIPNFCLCQNHGMLWAGRSLKGLFQALGGWLALNHGFVPLLEVEL